MFRTNRLLATASVMALSAFAATNAQAAGTIAGSTITNTATVNYQVGGVAQTAINASTAVTVDRKVTLTVAEVGTTTTSVSPGQAAVVTTYTVTNTSNAPLDFGLSLAQQTGGVGPHGGTDNFDVTAPSLFVDTNGNSVYDAGTDTAVTFLDEIAADASRVVFAVANVPAGRTNGDVSVVALTAQAREAGTAGTQGIIVAETAGANTAGQDTVFADTAGATDANRDGQFSAKDDYTVAAPVLTVTKTGKLISDPFNGTTNPKNIPGAVVEYCIIVANAAGGATATNIAVTDPLTAALTGTVGTGFINGTATAGVCNADGTAGGTITTTAASASLSNIAAGANRTFYFRSTIN